MPSIRPTNSNPTMRQPASATAMELAVILVLGSCIAVADAGWRMVGLLFVGLILGIALYQASFGFAGAYRRLFLHGEVDAVRAQLVLLGLTTILFVPGPALGRRFWPPV